MNKNTRKAIFAFGLTFFMSVSVMASNTLTFTGKVFDSSCIVTVNGGNATIDVGGLAKSDITAAGQTGAPKIFIVSLTSCPASGTGVPTKAYIKFSGTTETDSSYFKNSLVDANAATDIALLIKDSAGNAIHNNSGNIPVNLPVAGGNLDANYTASLVALSSTPGKGDYSTTITYSISYE